MLEKAATIKTFEYSLLGKELKAQADIAKKQHQALDRIYENDETINKKPTLKNDSKSYLIYMVIIVFTNYRDNKQFDKFSLKSKHSFLANFFDNLDKFTKLKTQKEESEKKKRKCV